MAKETLQEVIGKFIYAERKKQNLSLAKLSEKIYGNTHFAKQIMNIEKGKIKEYTVETLAKILHGLDYNMVDLFKHYVNQ